MSWNTKENMGMLWVLKPTIVNCTIGLFQYIPLYSYTFPWNFKVTQAKGVNMYFFYVLDFFGLVEEAEESVDHSWVFQGFVCFCLPLRHLPLAGEERVWTGLLVAGWKCKAELPSLRLHMAFFVSVCLCVLSSYEKSVIKFRAHSKSSEMSSWVY